MVDGFYDRPITKETAFLMLVHAQAHVWRERASWGYPITFDASESLWALISEINFKFEILMEQVLNGAS